jgi:outer membrane protein TolC
MKTARSRARRPALGAAFFLVIGLCWTGGLGAAEQAKTSGEPAPQPTPSVPPPGAPCPGGAPFLLGPVLTDDPAAPRLAAAQAEPDDRPLPINLATALRLGGARQIIIAAAEAGVETAAAQLARAHVLWLPSVYLGPGYYRHDGASQGQSGNFYINTKDQFMAGAGVVARFAAADAIFAPLAARQVLRARELDVQAARNTALVAVADAYFSVQAARGQVAATQDMVDKARALGEKVRLLAPGKLDPTDLHRARAELAEVEQSLITVREQWRRASADLTQVLRLDPSAVVVPLEPPTLRVTLISPRERVDDLIPIGLTNRPELASQQALVRAALTRIKQERIRPLVPSLILQGGSNPAAPANNLMAGVYASGAHGAGNPTSARDDVSVELVWVLDNLGFGNRALVRERKAEQQQLLVELFRLQDLVAGDVARAHAALVSAAGRSEVAARGLQEAQASYTGSLNELGKITKFEDVKVLVRREFEVVDALRALLRAYNNYFVSVNDYNRAQFRLYWAMGYPAEILQCEHSPGPILPVDTARPPQMAPVCPSDPCPDHQ